MIKCSKCDSDVLKTKYRTGEYDCHCSKCDYDFTFIEYDGE